MFTSLNRQHIPTLPFFVSRYIEFICLSNTKRHERRMEDWIWFVCLYFCSVCGFHFHKCSNEKEDYLSEWEEFCISEMCIYIYIYTKAGLSISLDDYLHVMTFLIIDWVCTNFVPEASPPMSCYAKNIHLDETFRLILGFCGILIFGMKLQSSMDYRPTVNVWSENYNVTKTYINRKVSSGRTLFT